MTLPFKRLLVTGGSGFIGSNFIHHVLHAYGGAPWATCCPDHARYETHAPVPGLALLNVDKLTYAGRRENLAGVDTHPAYSFVQADICDQAAMEQAFASFRPEAVVHFAAESHVDRSIESGDVFVRTNVLGTQVLLDAARRHGVKHFLHVSTDEVYGSIEKGSFKEGDRLHVASPYSASKAGSDLLVLAHQTTYKLPASITRCTNNYGPRQHPEKLLPKILGLAARDQKLPIYGSGLQVRDWLYVKDHCTGILTALNQPPGEIWNIGADAEKTNLEVVSAVLKLLGKPDSLIEHVKDRPGHDFRYSLDSSKLRAKGWTPRTPFEQGLPQSRPKA